MKTKISRANIILVIVLILLIVATAIVGALLRSRDEATQGINPKSTIGTSDATSDFTNTLFDLSDEPVGPVEKYATLPPTERAKVLGLNKKLPIANNNLYVRYSPLLEKFVIVAKTPADKKRAQEFIAQQGLREAQAKYNLFTITDREYGLEEEPSKRDESQDLENDPNAGTQYSKKRIKLMQDFFNTILGYDNTLRAPLENTGSPTDLNSVSGTDIAGSSNITFSGDKAKQDFEKGQMDSRIVALIRQLAPKYKLNISAAKSDHPKCISGDCAKYGPSQHSCGRAINIDKVNGEAVWPTSNQARNFIKDLIMVPSNIRPTIIGQPFKEFTLKYGFTFTDEFHKNQIHISYSPKCT